MAWPYYMRHSHLLYLQMPPVPHSLCELQYSPSLHSSEGTMGHDLVIPLHVTPPVPAPEAEQAPEEPLHARDVPSVHWMLTEQSPVSADSLVRYSRPADVDSSVGGTSSGGAPQADSTTAAATIIADIIFMEVFPSSTQWWFLPGCSRELAFSANRAASHSSWVSAFPLPVKSLHAL